MVSCCDCSISPSCNQEVAVFYVQFIGFSYTVDSIDMLFESHLERPSIFLLSGSLLLTWHNISYSLHAPTVLPLHVAFLGYEFELTPKWRIEILLIFVASYVFWICMGFVSSSFFTSVHRNFKFLLFKWLKSHHSWSWFSIICSPWSLEIPLHSYVEVSVFSFYVR